MYQVPAPIWNQIAQTQPVGSAYWLSLMEKDQQQLTEALAKLESDLERKGADAAVTRSYLLVAPLLRETVAISRYVDAQASPELRSCLPEVTSINEAVALATQEFRLKPSQQTRLAELLKTDWHKA